MPDELDWPAVRTRDAGDWDAVRQSFFENHSNFVNKMRSFGDERLDSLVPGERMTSGLNVSECIAARGLPSRTDRAAEEAPGGLSNAQRLITRGRINRRDASAHSAKHPGRQDGRAHSESGIDQMRRSRPKYNVAPSREIAGLYS